MAEEIISLRSDMESLHGVNQSAEKLGKEMSTKTLIYNSFEQSKRQTPDTKNNSCLMASSKTKVIKKTGLPPYRPASSPKGKSNKLLLNRQLDKQAEMHLTMDRLCLARTTDDHNKFI